MFVALACALSVRGAGPAHCSPSVDQNSHSLLDQLRRPDGWQQIKVLRDAKEFTTAEGEAKVHLDSAKRSHGEDSIEYAEVLDLLVEALMRGGRAGEPEITRLALSTSITKESQLGPDDVHLAESPKNLADVHQSFGRFAEAEELLDRASSIAEAYYGEDSPDIERFLRDHGNTLLAIGHFKRAKHLYERCLGLKSKLYFFDFDCDRDLDVLAASRFGLKINLYDNLRCNASHWLEHNLAISRFPLTRKDLAGLLIKLKHNGRELAEVA
jgi:tetratricopeptide (TPR) repeat protein